VATALAICGSPRRDGNTEAMLTRCLAGLEKAGIRGELIRLAEREIKPCGACGSCGKTKDRHCHGIAGDDFEPVFAAMQAADIIVVGSPVYFGSATPNLMALLDRAGYVARANGGLFTRKLGGPLVVARRAGQNFTLAQLVFWYLINDMVVPGSSYWNMAFGRQPGEVGNDQEGMATVDRFADNLAWLAGRTLPA
jgi:multimeric flavodoxin WrbA